MKRIIQYFNEVCINELFQVSENLYKDPSQFAEYITELKKTLDKLGVEVVKETLETMDEAIKKSAKRKSNWHVEKSNCHKDLITTLGTVSFNKTLYVSKEANEEGKHEMCYLLDKVMGFEENQRLTEDAMVKVYEEAVQTSYRRGGEAVNEADSISKTAVKEILHKTQFPEIMPEVSEKKKVEYLYVDADEDHYALQFQEKKGDLEVSESGRKKNGAITKLVYVYEGVEPEAPGSKRNKLINTRYFCSGSDESNKDFWARVRRYIETVYETESIKKIYVNSDGGKWIKEGMNQLGSIEYVLDEFHLSKYIIKMTSHMLDSQEDARIEICECIRNNTKKEFNEIVDRLIGCAKTEAQTKKIEDAAKYISKNWSAAKRRLWRRDGVCGCSAEGHVSHVLSSRMSTPALGWSRLGASKMARLREWSYNKESMLELVRWQSKELPMVAGAEDIILSSSEILSSEIDRRSKTVKETGKYTEIINTTLELKTKRQLGVYVNTWI